MIRIPPDFKEFLQLLNDHQVEYLLVGGYAVGYHGYPRATVDMDIWVAIKVENSEKIVATLRSFGFDVPELEPGIFLQEEKIIRLGVPPVRLEIITSISGVDFDKCYKGRIEAIFDGIKVNIINLEHLKINKLASGRHKDLNDLEHLA